MNRRWFVVAEVVGALVLGWTLTRFGARVLSLPDLTLALDGFVEGSSNDFFPLVGPAFSILALQFLCLMGVALVATFLARRPIKSTFGVVRGVGSHSERIASAITLYCVFGLPMRLLLAANEFVDLGAEPSYWGIFAKDWNPGFWLFMAVGSFVVIPIFEELFYRGYAQARLTTAFGFGGALFVALLFTSAHFQYLRADVLNIGMLVALATAAFAMAYARYSTGSVVGPIVIHALMNVPVTAGLQVVALGAMVLWALWSREQVRAQLAGMREAMEAIVLVEAVVLFLVILGFVLGMTRAPGVAVGIAALGFAVSVAVQRLSREREVSFTSQ